MTKAANKGQPSKAGRVQHSGDSPNSCTDHRGTSSLAQAFGNLCSFWLVEILWMDRILYQVETMVCWNSKGHHHSCDSSVAQDFVHPQYETIWASTSCVAIQASYRGSPMAPTHFMPGGPCGQSCIKHQTAMGALISMAWPLEGRFQPTSNNTS